MKVALVTSWDERCGIAEYAKNLISNCPEVEFDIIPRTWGIQESAFNVIKFSDVVHVNYEPGILGHWTSEVIRRLNKPSVLTLHTSNEGDNRTVFTDAFTKVVTHEKTLNTGTHNFVYIPHGIPVFNNINVCPINFEVGTCGFPFPWKGFTQVVEACKNLNASCLVIAPESRHCDTKVMKEHLLSIYDNITYISEWLDQEAVISLLKECKINAFLYHGGNYGISGASKMGIATGNKIVLTRNRQFRDLYDYEDEVHFVSNPPNVDEVTNTFRHLLNNIGNKPKRLLEDFSWKKTAEMYKKLYEEINR